MATLNIQISNICSGGNHADITVTGDYTFNSRITIPEFLDAITDEEKEAFLAVLFKILSAGKTPQQIKTALLNGIEVNI